MIAQAPKTIQNIFGKLKVCNIHKIELIDEYFDHIFLPKYTFRYELKAIGKCEIPDCPREAFCTIEPITEVSQ